MTPALFWASGPWLCKWSLACLLAMLCTLMGQSVFLSLLPSGIWWAIGGFLVFVLKTNIFEVAGFLSISWFILQRNALVLSGVRNCYLISCWFETRKLSSHLNPFMKSCRSRQQVCRPLLGRLRQEDPSFPASSHYMGGLGISTQQNKNHGRKEYSEVINI